MVWLRRVFNVLRRGKLSAEFQREVAFHLAERADDLMASGMTRQDAMREARRRFGGRLPQSDETKQRDPLLWVESVLADIRYAARSLLRSPGFTTVAVLSLGLGIGANTAIFSLYNALVLRTLPVQDPQELLQVTYADERTSFTNPLWEEFRDQQDVLSGVFAFSNRTFNLADGGEVRNVQGAWVSGDFFRTLGVLPAAGRLIVDSDGFRGCPAVAAVSYGFWQRQLSGDVGAIGSSLMLNGNPFELIGVVNPAFSGVDVGRATEVYAPLCTQPIVFPDRDWLDARSTWFLRVLGRPERDLSVEQVSVRLESLSTGVFGATVPDLWDTDNQARYREYKFGARSAPNGVSAWRGTYRPALLVLMGVVGAVLLIACGNVANLLLARATRRQHEVSIRRAIGSSRGRLVRLLVTESLLLSFVSAIVAIQFARRASSFIVGMLSTSRSLWLDLTLDVRVLLFTVAVAVLSGLFFGLAPAWRATSAAPQSALRTAGREATDREGRFSMGKALVVGQLAVSLCLVVGAGLLIGTLTRLSTVDTGFNREGILLATVDTRNAGYSEEESANANDQILARIRGLPGVRSASSSVITPIGNSLWNNYVDVDGYEPADRSETSVWFNSVSDEYFATLETPMLAGRDFDSRDAEGSVPVAVINETMAHQFFGEPQPLGRHFRTGSAGQGPVAYEVVGVVEDTKYRSMDEEQNAIAYFSLKQRGAFGSSLEFELRSDGAPAALMASVANVIAEVHPRISVRFTTLEDQVAASLTRPRLLAVLSGFFGGVALLLAMLGLYGTLAYRVTSRRNEIGVRLALGAARTRVIGMVLGEVGRLVVLGVAVGVGLTFAVSRLLTSFLFDVTATDPVTVSLSAVALGVVAVAAGALPAWHASRLDPMQTLREE